MCASFSYFSALLLSAGCVSLDPHYSTPESPIPATLPGAQAGEGNQP